MGRQVTWLVVSVIAVVCFSSLKRQIDTLSCDLDATKFKLSEEDSGVIRILESHYVDKEAFGSYINRVDKLVKDVNSHLLMRSNSNLRLIGDTRKMLGNVSEKVSFMDSLPKLAKRLTPSVVKVEVDLGYDEYWGQKKGWTGSGVFIADDLILTAGHVVDLYEIETNTDPEYLYKVGAPVTVRLVNGTELKVVDVYMEKTGITDIGLIKVKLPDVHIQVVGVGFVSPNPLSFGVVEVGERVFAIGEPFGYFPTVTAGIVSALNVDDNFFGQANLLQTDCPINPGNSGCPLFNMNGEIVAIVVGMYGVAPQNSGIGFCVPAKVCQAVIEKYNAIKTLEKISNE